MSSTATLAAPTTAGGMPTPIRCCAPLASPALSDVEAGATAALFKALADPNRVRIVHLLATSPGPVCVCDLTEPLGIGQPTVSHHLRKLLDAGLVRREARGTWAYYSLDGDALHRLVRVADLTGAAGAAPTPDTIEATKEA
jgi:ArsR family transcriptional regulator, arsenate/arsenite/antimonite-responsive transcriptional repressor